MTVSLPAIFGFFAMPVTRRRDGKRAAPAQLQEAPPALHDDLGLPPAADQAPTASELRDLLNR